MSGFSKIAVPGGIPVSGGGRNDVTPENLFRTSEEVAKKQSAIPGVRGYSDTPELKIKCVKVRLFDLSDQKQVQKYEKLRAELLEKEIRREAAVDIRKDLVHRADGTSYWLKYVEYVEYSNPRADDKPGNTKDKKKDRGL